jgi:hypothetical protein
VTDGAVGVPAATLGTLLDVIKQRLVIVRSELVALVPAYRQQLQQVRSWLFDIGVNIE